MKLRFAFLAVLVGLLLAVVVARAQQPTEEQKIAANKAYAKSTEVWLGDEKGSENFTWEGVVIKVPRPPSLTVKYDKGKTVMTGKDDYGKWYDTWLRPYTEKPCSFTRDPDEMQVADWRNAKRWAYWKKTGEMPVFTPPYPNSPGGHAAASIG